MGYLNIVAAIMIWSSLGIFVRKIELPVAAIIFYQSLIAGVLQLIWLSGAGTIRPPEQGSAGFRAEVLLALLPFCLIANMVAFYYAFTHTTIANALLTHYTAPVFVALSAPLLLKERIGIQAWIMIALSSIGLWFIISSSVAGGIKPVQRGEFLGVIAGVCSGIAYAFIILILRYISSRFSSLLIVFIQNGIISLLLLPFAVPIAFYPLLMVTAMGILHSTIAPVLYFNGFKRVKATEAAILGYFEPVGAIILALILLQEVPDMRALIGGACILFSGVIIMKRRAA